MSIVARQLGTFVMIAILMSIAIGISSYTACRDSSVQLPVTRTIADAYSKDPIFLDAVRDSSEIFHLIWLSADRGMYYQHSENLGKTWSTATQLAAPLPSPVTTGPKIINRGDRFAVFWLSRRVNVLFSDDRGASWSTPELELDLGTSVRDFDIDVKGDLVSLVFFSGKYFYYTRSEDFGVHWSSPRCLSAEIRSSYSVSAPSIAILDSSVHVIWSQFDGYGDDYGGEPRPTLQYLRSTDLGLSWDDASELQISGGDNGNDLMYPILYADICASGGQLHSVYQTNIVEHQSSNDLGATWIRQRPLTQTVVRALKLAGNGPGNTQIVWIDERHQKCEWWGYIPGHQALLWNADPTWADNDLFHTTLLRDGASYETRLTNPLSYVEPRRDALVALIAVDSVFVFWSGKARVGRSLAESNTPNELYYCALAFKQ